MAFSITSQPSIDKAITHNIVIVKKVTIIQLLELSCQSQSL